jgi:alpha-1,3-mannosyl-glycoprotein beta-1,2-N-acetylglucosaminyltransferase
MQIIKLESKVKLTLRATKNILEIPLNFEKLINNHPVISNKQIYIYFKAKYDDLFDQDVYSKSTHVSFDDYIKNKTIYSLNNTPLLLTYDNKSEFLKLAQHFGIMQDFKAGVPRTAYKGVVRIYFDSCLIYIAAKEKIRWSGYPKDW